MVHCCVVGCKSDSESKNPNLSFHSFPDDDKTLCQKWMEVTGRTNLSFKKSMRICSRHFESNLLIKKKKLTILYPNAVPTLNIKKSKNKNYLIKKKKLKMNPVVKLERLKSDVFNEKLKQRILEASDSSSEDENVGRFFDCMYNGVWNKSKKKKQISEESDEEMPEDIDYDNKIKPHWTKVKMRKNTSNVVYLENKELVLNKYKQIEEKWPLEQYPYKKSLLYKKTAKDLRISVDIVRQILTKSKIHQLNVKSLPKLNDLMENSIRKIIHKSYMAGELPTKESVLQIINDDINLPYFNMATFNCLLNYLKIETVKKRNNYPLIDREDIMLERINYLKKIKEYRKNRCVYYLDELILLAENTLEENSNNSSNMIIVYIGNENGFVKDCLGIFCTNSKSEHRIEAVQFEDWLKKNIFKLKNGSIIVMDDASYHTRKQELTPTVQWTKKGIQEFMSNNKIDYDKDNLKFELLSKIKKYKNKNELFLIDKIAKKNNIEILRIPSFHNELNPMTSIWSNIIDDIKKLKKINVNVVTDALDNLPVEKWRDAIKNVVELEENFYSKIDHVMDEAIDRYLEKVLSDSHSEGSEEEEDFLK